MRSAQPSTLPNYEAMPSGEGKPMWKEAAMVGPMHWMRTEERDCITPRVGQLMHGQCGVCGAVSGRCWKPQALAYASRECETAWVICWTEPECPGPHIAAA
jgi:hypothetical protein